MIVLSAIRQDGKDYGLILLAEVKDGSTSRRGECTLCLTHGPEHRASLCTRQLAHGLQGRLKQPCGAGVEDETALAVAATLPCRALVAPANERNPRRDTPARARDRNELVREWPNLRHKTLGGDP